MRRVRGKVKVIVSREKRRFEGKGRKTKESHREGIIWRYEREILVKQGIETEKSEKGKIDVARKPVLNESGPVVFEFIVGCKLFTYNFFPFPLSKYAITLLCSCTLGASASRAFLGVGYNS
mgnify:CR=1 FL=1